MTQIPSSALIVHRFNTLPRHFADLDDDLDWNNNTLVVRGREANRGALKWDPSMGTDPGSRFHIRDCWFGQEPWSAAEYDKFEGRC